MAEVIIIETKTKDEFKKVVEKLLSERIKWSSGCDLIEADKWETHKEKTCIMKEKYNGEYVLKCGPLEIFKNRRESSITLSSSEFLELSKQMPIKNI